MINRFKIWFNRNDMKIITIIVIIVLGSLIIKNLNNHYKKQIEKEKLSTENTTTEEKITKSPIQSEDDLQKVNEQTDEYKKVTTVLNIILKNLHLAQENNDQSAKENVFNFCTDEVKNRIVVRGRAITTDNISEHLSGVEDMGYLTLDGIFKFDDNNNVKRYVAKEIYDNHGPATYARYMIINMDYNNNTFSYDGEFLVLSYIDYNKKIEKIENKGNNVF